MKFRIDRVNGAWRWRLFARNGKAVAQSVERYRNIGDCKDAIQLVKSTNDQTPIEEQDAHFVDVE
jgi:uncharacterized protein YegP (UPF0339 family)